MTNKQITELTEVNTSSNIKLSIQVTKRHLYSIFHV